MIDTNLDIKAKFAEMAKMIFITSNGKFQFPFDDLRHSQDWNEFKSNPDWKILEKKMFNLIELVNRENSILELDLETQIWEMV